MTMPVAQSLTLLAAIALTPRVKLTPWRSRMPASSPKSKTPIPVALVVTPTVFALAMLAALAMSAKRFPRRVGVGIVRTAAPNSAACKPAFALVVRLVPNPISWGSALTTIAAVFPHPLIAVATMHNAAAREWMPSATTTSMKASAGKTATVAPTKLVIAP